jgi:GT2 family glycosyltransferase
MGLTSVVIPVRDNPAITEQCLQALCKSTTTPLEIIVVDNGSAAKTEKILKRFQVQARVPVKIVRNEENQGFPVAVNQGMAQAAGDQILIMNNDVIVPKGFLEPMLAALRLPDVGVVGPRSNSVSGVQAINVPYGNNLAAMERYAAERRKALAGTGFLTSRAVGFCLLISRSVANKIGGFDPVFGIGNFEDDDFVARSQVAGFKVFIANDAFVHHLGSATFRSDQVDYRKLMLKNFDVLMAKWMMPLELKLEDGIPYGLMLQQKFSPELHFIPLCPARTDEQLKIPNAKGRRFLVMPDWYDENDRVWEALRAFSTLPTEPKSTLLLRVDPLIVRRLDVVLGRIRQFVAQERLRLSDEHPVIVVNDVVPPSQRSRLYASADAIVDTRSSATFSWPLYEASALGLPVVVPDTGALRRWLEGH